jgi:uncharacterized membrane protein
MLSGDDGLKRADKYQMELSRLKFKQETERDRTLVLVSGGALTVSFAFIATFLEHHALTLLGWLIGGWIAWTASLAATVIGYSLSIALFGARIEALSKAEWAEARKQSPAERWIEPVNWITGILVIVGFISFGYFAIGNLARESPHGQVKAEAAATQAHPHEEGPDVRPRTPGAAADTRQLNPSAASGAAKADAKNEDRGKEAVVKGAVLMSDDYSHVFSLVGLALNLLGVLILFRWGMPFHVPAGGATFRVTSQVDTSGVALERIYTIIGYVGLALLIAGTVLQMVAVLMPDKKLP